MPVPFACPYCGEQTLVDEQFAGQTGPCIGCGKLISVPQFATAASVAALAQRPPAQASARSKFVMIAIGGLAVVAGMVTILVLLAGPLLEAAQVQRNRRTCAANLRRIGTALLQYERDYLSLPPAVVKDASGKPLYSWRVLILPYLGPQEDRLYKQFQLDEAWNSPANSRLLAQMPRVYRSPGDPNANADETSYVVVAGPSTPFPSDRPFSVGQISDGSYATILVIEQANTGIAWTEPKDLIDTQLSFQIGVDIGGSHDGGMNALFADGNVRFLPDTLSMQEVMDLVTANGGEVVRSGDLDY